MDKLVTTKELADHFKVTRQTIYNWRKQGVIPEDCFQYVSKKTFRYNLTKIEERFAARNYKPEQLEFDFEEPEAVEPPVQMAARETRFSISDLLPNEDEEQ